MNLRIPFMILLFAASNTLSAKPERFFVFDTPWTLTVDLEGYEIQKNKYDHETKQRKIFALGENGFTLSLFIEPSGASNSAKECRAFYVARLRQAPYERQNEKLYESGEMALYHQDVKTFEGTEINQKSYNAYLYKDQLCIDVHISKIKFEPNDEATLQGTLKTIKIVPKNSMDYFGAGSYMYMDKNYQGASFYYARALDLEKKKRTLTGEPFYALVDNLGISLAYSGEMEKAKEVFLYGTKAEPKYALFHYNLACTYAEDGDVEAAVRILKKAINLAATQGAKIPDYKTDSSFQKIRDSEEFKKALTQ